MTAEAHRRVTVFLLARRAPATVEGFHAFIGQGDVMRTQDSAQRSTGDSEHGGGAERPTRRVSFIAYLIRHLESGYCDECLDSLTAGHTNTSVHSSLGEMSIERSDGVCVNCRRQATVTEARKMQSLADVPAGLPHENQMRASADRDESQSAPKASASQLGEQRVMDLVMRALLLAKVEALQQAQECIRKQVAELEAAIADSS